MLRRHEWTQRVRRHVSQIRRQSCFQIMSDLHLEVNHQYKTFDIPVLAPILLLAGDVGQLQHYDDYLAFLDRQCHNFDLVCLVLGNHEFYGTSRENGLRLARKLEQEDKLDGRLKILSRDRVDVLDKVSILGCTLHSNIRDENQTVISAKVKDFIRIEGWTVQDHIEEHRKDLQWLRDQLTINDLKQHVIVMTHHAPLAKGCCNPQMEGSILHDAFSTDIIDKHSELCRADWWVFGHTHHTTQLKQNGIHLVSNQRGYVLNTAKAPPDRSGWRKEKFDVQKQIRV